MKQKSALFLKFVLIIIALVSAALLIWLPQTEGRATNLDLVSIYSDPLIIYSFIASIPFFVALFNAFKLLGYIEQNNVFSAGAVKMLTNIKKSALVIIAFIVGAIVYIRFMLQGDDPAGPTMLGLVAIFATTVIATGVAVAEKMLQTAVDLKSENDLTV